MNSLLPEKPLRTLIRSFLQVFGTCFLAMASTTDAAVLQDGYSFSTISNGSLALAKNGSNLKLTASGSPTADTEGFFTQFSPVTLGIGETATVSFTIKNAALIASTSGFRVAFANMPISSGDQASPNPSWASGTRQGYSIYLSTGSNNTINYREFNGAPYPLGTGGVSTLGTGGTAGVLNGAQTTVFSLQIARIDATSITIGGSIGGIAFTPYTDTSAITFDFNTVVIGSRQYNTSTVLELTDFNVIPEPSSLALAFAGLVFAGACVRGRNRIP